MKEVGGGCPLGATDSFQSMSESFTPTSLFFVLVGIALVFPFGAHAKGTGFVPSVNNVSSVAPVHPAHIDWEKLDRMMIGRGLVPNGYRSNPTPAARDATLPPLQPIDTSPNHKEKWKGNLSNENLQRQMEQAELLRDHGENLRFRLHQIDPNHNLLTPDIRLTINGSSIRGSITEDIMPHFDLKRTLNLGDAAFAQQNFQVSETTLEQYRAWGTCAETFSNVIDELRRAPR